MDPVSNRPLNDGSPRPPAGGSPLLGPVGQSPTETKPASDAEVIRYYPARGGAQVDRTFRIGPDNKLEERRTVGGRTEWVDATTGEKGIALLYYADGRLYNAKGECLGLFAINPRTAKADIDGRTFLETYGTLQRGPGRFDQYFGRNLTLGSESALIRLGPPPIPGLVAVYERSERAVLVPRTPADGGAAQPALVQVTGDRAYERVWVRSDQVRDHASTGAGTELSQVQVEALFRNGADKDGYCYADEGRIRIKVTRTPTGVTYTAERKMHVPITLQDSKELATASVVWVSDTTVIRRSPGPGSSPPTGPGLGGKPAPSTQETLIPPLGLPSRSEPGGTPDAKVETPPRPVVVTPPVQLPRATVPAAPAPRAGADGTQGAAPVTPPVEQDRPMVPPTPQDLANAEALLRLYDSRVQLDQLASTIERARPDLFPVRRDAGAGAPAANGAGRPHVDAETVAHHFEEAIKEPSRRYALRLQDQGVGGSSPEIRGAEAAAKALQEFVPKVKERPGKSEDYNIDNAHGQIVAARRKLTELIEAAVPAPNGPGGDPLLARERAIALIRQNMKSWAGSEAELARWNTVVTAMERDLRDDASKVGVAPRR